MLLQSWMDCVGHSAAVGYVIDTVETALNVGAGIRPDRHVQLSVVGILMVF